MGLVKGKPGVSRGRKATGLVGGRASQPGCRRFDSMTFWDGSNWVTEAPRATDVKPKGRVRRLAAATLRASMITALTFGMVAGTAFAGKGGGGATTGGDTLTGPVMVFDRNASGAIDYGDDITFSVTTSASRAQVGLRCYQGTNFVYDGYVATYDSWLSAKYFTLSGSYWSSALDASCTARLFAYDRRGRELLLAPKLTFTVTP